MRRSDWSGGLCGLPVTRAGLVLAAAGVLAGCEGATQLDGTGGGGTVVSSVEVSTIERPWGGTVGDLVVDEGRGLLYVSVLERNEVEILDYTVDPDNALTDRVLVGSQPAGMALDRTGDTLIVANSGGTSLSFVDLAAGIEKSRLETPNATLYSFDEDPEADSTGAAALLTWQDYSDRPLSVAQDRDGVIFYSTVGGGPLRMVEAFPSFQTREANIMLWSDVLVEAEQKWAVTYLDSMIIRPESVVDGGSRIVAYDHIPGRPNTLIQAQGGVSTFGAIMSSLRAQGSDVFWAQDMNWNTGFWDTGGGEGGEGGEEGVQAPGTLFETSRDRSVVLIGDGPRLWTWQAVGAHPGLSNRIISSYFAMGDFETNAGIEGITGLGVDATGDQFAARGGGSVVYFNDLLRVHGSHRLARLSGSGGLARHPTLPIVFAATDDRTILVLEASDHYQVLTEIPVGENWVGPLRLSLPRSGDPEGLVARLHSVTEAGNVVTASITERVLP